MFFNKGSWGCGSGLVGSVSTYKSFSRCRIVRNLDVGPNQSPTFPCTMDHGPWTMDHGPRTMDHGPYANGYKHRGVFFVKNNTFMRSPAMMTITIRPYRNSVPGDVLNSPRSFF